MASVGVKPEIRRQVIADFYRQNVQKGKPYTLEHFKRMGYKRTQIYAVMKRVDAGESVERKKGQDLCSDEDEIIRLFRSIKANIQITANEGPYATFR